MTTTERVCGVVSAILRVPAESLDDRSSPDTLPSWDSLRHLQVVLALEETFGVQFTVDEIEAMQSVGVITAIVDSHVADPHERAVKRS